MLFDTPIISQGSSIINVVVESGTAYPANGDPGEVFFRTDLNDFVFRGLSSWNRYAQKTVVDTHIADMNLHLTTAEKTLISGITVPASDINSIPQMKTDITSVTTNLASHAANMALHITAAQNTFLDALNLPTLTGANVNTLVGQTVLLSTQFGAQTTATNQVQTNLNLHAADQTIHVLPTQRIWLDGIDMVKITPSIINSLDSIVAGGTAATKLPLAGGTMTGSIAMSNNKVTGLGAPTATTDAATKKYVDDSVAAVDLTGLVKKTGDTMSGALAMGNNKITGLGTPTATTDAVTKAYADGKVAKTGDTMSGDLNMGTKKVVNVGAPVAGTDVTNKTYVDGIETSVLSKAVLLAGSTMTGDLNMGTKKVTGLGAPAVDTDATNKAYVDGVLDTKLSTSGGTMSGPITMGNQKISGLGTPTATSDATTKTYVDNLLNGKLNLTGGTMSGAIAMGNQKITGLGAPTATTDATTKTYVDNLLNGKLNLSGGTMTGPIAMGAHKITTSFVPVDPVDVANKAYVDARTSSGLNAETANKLTVGRHFMLTGAVFGGSLTPFDGTANVTIETNWVDATKLTGQIPRGALTDIGVSQADTEARDFYETDDMNAMVKVGSGGVYTLATQYVNGPVRATSTSYTGLMQVLRRKFNAGPAIIQTVWHGFPTNKYERVGNFGASNVWQWSEWEQVVGANSNVATAARLQTPRDIAIGSAVVSFDGSANVKFTGDTLAFGGNLMFNSDMNQMSTLTGNNPRPFGLVAAGNAAGRTHGVTPTPFGGVGTVRNMFSTACTSSTNSQYLDITNLFSEFSPVIKPGQTYTVSAMVRGTAKSDLRQYIQYCDAAGNVISTAVSPATVATGDWQRMTYVSNPPAPANAVSATIYFGRIIKTSASPSAMSIDVLEPMFQEGELATAYAPSNETCSIWSGTGITDPTTNFNNVTAPGEYFIWITPSTMANSPPTTSWGKMLVSRAAARVVQAYTIDGGFYTTYTRWSSDGGNIWKPWVASNTDLGVSYGASQVAITNTLGTNAMIAVANSTQAGVMSSADKVKLDTVATNATENWNSGTPIATNGTDLNTLQAPGPYFCSANAVAATLPNCPTSKAFAMQVYATAGVVQFLTTYSSNASASNESWVRGFYNGNWNEWQTIFNSRNPQVTTTTDTPGTNNLNIASTAFVQQAVSGSLVKAVTGGTATLSAAEASNVYVSFQGVQTSNQTVNFPAGVHRMWIVSNYATGGAFTLNVGVTGQASKVEIPRGTRQVVFSEGSGMFIVDDAIRPIISGGTGTNTATGSGSLVLQTSPNLLGVPTTPTAAVGTNNTQIASTAYVKANLAALNASSLTTGTVPNARMAGTYDGITLRLNGTNTLYTTPRGPGSDTVARTVYGLSEYRNSASNATGAIVFIAPNTTSTIMYTFDVLGREHVSSGGSITQFVASGYRTTGAWSNTQLSHTGTKNVMVRFGVTADGKNCLILGDVGTVWAYPHVTVRLALMSHNGTSDTVASGWISQHVTDLTGYTQVTPALTTTAIAADITGASASAAILTTTRQINGTNFNGAGNIITANWGTYRNLTIGSTAKSVNGAVNVAWSLAEIGAAPTSHTHAWAQLPFTPIQQGGGPLQGGNTVRIGWASNGDNRLRLQVDSTDFGHLWPISATAAQTADRTIAYGTAPAVEQKGDLGSAFADWSGGANPALQVDAPRPDSAYMIWRATQWGQRHIASMHAYAGGSNSSPAYASISVVGSVNTFTFHGNGDFTAIGNVVAYYSDERLKENIARIDSPLSKLKKLNGVTYNANALAGSFGFDVTKKEVGLLAQQVKEIMPEVIHRAPFDRDVDGTSKSGENYMTVDYARVVPLLVESIKELEEMVTKLTKRIGELENR